MPILLFVALGVVGLIAIAKHDDSPKTSTVISGGKKPTALDYVCAFIKARKPVPRFLVRKALYECAEKGDWKTFHSLAESFKHARRADEEKTEEKNETPSDGAQPELVVGKNSPLQGVSNDEWNEFVGTLKTHEPSFRDDAHVGAFYHSKRRIAELGLDPDKLDGEEAQYSALEADIKDASERYKRFINDWAGDVISLNGQQTPVTRSGLYGLVKCAGIEGAKAWLSNDGDRMKYPNTTAMFLKMNGKF